MKIIRLSSTQLKIEVEPQALWVGSAIASIILPVLGIQQLIARRMWERLGQFDLWDWGIIIIFLVAADSFYKLFTEEYVDGCLFDLKNHWVEIEMHHLLGKKYQKRKDLNQLQDIRIHIEYGDNNDYYFIALAFSHSGKQALILPERTEDRSVIEEKVNIVREFLGLSLL